MIEHLSKPEYVHVLMNPLPVYGLAVGVLGLVIALLSKTRAARVTALALVMVSAASAWPVYHYGEAGYDRVKSMVDEAGDKWLDEHMRRGEQLIYVLYVVAALSAVGIVARVCCAEGSRSAGRRDADSRGGKSRCWRLHRLRGRSCSA